MSIDLEDLVRDGLRADAPSEAPGFDWLALRGRARRRAAIRRAGTVAVGATVVTVLLVATTPWAAAPPGVDPITSPSRTSAGRTSELPGADIDTALAPPVTSTHTGSATVELGEPPAGATHVEMAIVCLSAGTITYPDLASITCSGDDAGSAPALYTLPLPTGAPSLRFDANAAVEWQLTTTFVNRVETDWATNANGDTYGVVKEDGSSPHLVAVVATNGKVGYAYADDLGQLDVASPEEALAWQEAHAGQSSTIPVYAEDGVTIVGAFDTSG